MNTRCLIHEAVGRNVAVALVVIGLVVAACVPPPPTSQGPTATSTSEPTPAEAGVALGTDLSAGESSYHLWSVDAGYTARNYEEFMRFCVVKPECLNLLRSPGQVELRVNRAGDRTKHTGVLRADFGHRRAAQRMEQLHLDH